MCGRVIVAVCFVYLAAPGSVPQHVCAFQCDLDSVWVPHGSAEVLQCGELEVIVACPTCCADKLRYFAYILQFPVRPFPRLSHTPREFQQIFVAVVRLGSFQTLGAFVCSVVSQITCFADAWVYSLRVCLELPDNSP